MLVLFSRWKRNKINTICSFIEVHIIQINCSMLFIDILFIGCMFDTISSDKHLCFLHASKKRNGHTSVLYVIQAQGRPCIMLLLYQDVIFPSPPAAAAVATGKDGAKAAAAPSKDIPTPCQWRRRRDIEGHRHCSCHPRGSSRSGTSTGGRAYCCCLSRDGELNWMMMLGCRIVFWCS